MRKLLIVAMAVIMAFSFVACGGGGGGTDTGTGGGGTEKAKTPADSYSKYVEVKGAAFERLTDKIGQHDELAMTAGMAILPITMIDLALLPLTIVGMEGGEATLEMLGMKNIDVKQDGDVYTITYTDPEGKTLTQTCEFDAKTDSMRSVISDGDKESLTFEYVNTGKGYASQYVVLSEESGNYSLMKSFFNDTGFVGFGTKEDVKGEPDSIFKNTKLTSDFVENEETFMTLDGDVMTVFMDGETQTF